MTCRDAPDILQSFARDSVTQLMDHGRLALQRCRSAMQSPPAGTRALGRQRDMKPLRADTVKVGRICGRSC